MSEEYKFGWKDPTKMTREELLADREQSRSSKEMLNGALYTFGESTIEVDFVGDPLDPPFERVGEVVECMTPKEQLVDDLVHFVALLAGGWSLYAFGGLVNQYVLSRL